MPMHPLPAIMNHGVHVALCSDDPAVFGNMGLTFDFFQVTIPSSSRPLSLLVADAEHAGVRRERGERSNYPAGARLGQHPG